MLEVMQGPSPPASRPDQAERERTGQAQRVLVTGGNGFIGAHLVEALAGRGYRVRVLDIAAPAQPLAGVEYVCGSMLDRSAVLCALDGVAGVYHLAGMAHLWAADSADFDRINRAGTELMLSAACEKGVRRFLHCSTEVVLLPPARSSGPIDESIALDVADMAGPYSRSKYLAEQAAFAAAAQGQDVVIVNPTIPLGTGDRNFTPPTAMLAHYLSGARFFLDCMLNLVDVRDIAAGMILAMERGRAGQRYLLGGANIALGDLLTMLDQASGRRTMRLPVPPLLARVTGAICEWVASHLTGKSPIATVEGVRIGLRSVRFNSGKAIRQLGYAPRPVEAALVDAARWLAGGSPAAPNQRSSDAAAVSRQGTENSLTA